MSSPMMEKISVSDHHTRMLVEVDDMPEGKGIALVNSMICRLEWIFQESIHRIDALARIGEAM